MEDAVDHFKWIGEEEKKEKEVKNESAAKTLKEYDEKEDAAFIETAGEKVNLLPGKLAVLALVDIAPELKELRNIPQFFHIKRPTTSIGTGRGMHVKVPDLKTIKTKHGIIVFKNGQFRVYPEEGEIKVNGKRIFSAGEVLKNGSQIEAGSARFVFLTNIESNVLE